MATNQYVPAPRVKGGNYEMDDDTVKFQRRAPAIRHDLATIEDFCVNEWSIQEMITYYNFSKPALIKTGLLLATQLYDIIRYLKLHMDQTEHKDDIKILAAFWIDNPIDAICRNANITMDKLFEMGFRLAHKFYNSLMAAGLKEHLIVETLVYNSQGYGLDIATAFKRTMSDEKQMKLQMEKDKLAMFGMQSALQRW